jgi:hypothetical protein
MKRFYATGEVATKNMHKTRVFSRQKIAVLAVILLVLLPLTQSAQAQMVNSATDKAYRLVTVVAPLDATKYTLSPPAYSSTNSSSDYAITEEYINYNLTADQNSASVQVTFQNGRPFTLTTTAENNTQLIYTQPSGNFLDLAKSVIERYQAFLGDGSLKEMISAIKTVATAKNTTVTFADTELTILKSNTETSFSWKHVISGCKYNEVSIVFQGDHTFMLGDMQSRYKMGNTEVKVSDEQAMDKAAAYIANYSYPAISQNGTVTNVSGFEDSKTNMSATLLPTERDGLLYPAWEVEVPLLKSYPGHPQAFLVTIWADTGDFVKLETVSPGGAYQLGFFGDDDGSDVQDNNNFGAIVDIGARILTVVIIVLSIFFIVRTLKKRNR